MSTSFEAPRGIEPEVLKTPDFKSHARKEIIKTLESIWDMKNHMPVIRNQDQSKASPDDPNYYSYKVVDSVFAIARDLLNAIDAKGLVSDAVAIDQVRHDHNELDNMLAERYEIRQNMTSAGKKPQEVREYMNGFGESQNQILDAIVLRTVEALTGEAGMEAPNNSEQAIIH